MSNIIPFPSKIVTPITPAIYSCDIDLAAKGGFSHIDACVPAELALQFLALVNRCEDCAGVSLDVTQPKSRGMMLIDACVPSSVAEEFQAIVAAAA
jgi:hypothetical protein